MNKVNKKYTKENIINWFYNYITFYNINDLKKISIEQIKNDYIKGEKREIEYYTKSIPKQKEILKEIELIIHNLEIDKNRIENSFKYLI